MEQVDGAVLLNEKLKSLEGMQVVCEYFILIGAEPPLKISPWKSLLIFTSINHSTR